MVINKILKARENRLYKIKQIQSNNAVIVVKANIVGENKNLNIAYLLTNLFKGIVKKKIKIMREYFHESADGPYYLLLTSKDINHKNVLVGIEENHPLGRYIDLDLYVNGDTSISRNDLNLNRRKCFICENDAIICNRNHNHSNNEIINYMNQKIKYYLLEVIDDLVLKSIYYELNLDNKFGLVTPTSKGSHLDMDYELMQVAINSMHNYFGKMFACGYKSDSLDEAYIEGKEIGKVAEKAMYQATNGINCYKGLIFILGLACISSGYVLSHNQKYDNIYENIAIMTKDIFDEKKYHTFGEYAYEKYQFGGAKAEARNGLKTVKLATHILKNENEINNKVLYRTLIGIIENCNDTVMLKRAKSLSKFYYFKNKIGTINYNDMEAIKNMTSDCISNNISCGGAADILITAIYLYQLKEIFW